LALELDKQVPMQLLVGLDRIGVYFSSWHCGVEEALERIDNGHFFC